MKTKLEIIEETITYYSENLERRALEEGSCRYLTSKGQMCAFGRCMTEESLNKYGKYQGSVWGLINNKVLKSFSCAISDKYIINEPLKPEYQGHSVNFWSNIQGLHDLGDYWNEKGLTKLGRKRVIELKEIYKS